MIKFTQGEWEYDDEHGCIHHDGRLIAEVAGGGGANYRHAEGQANARLIAAAPEMYNLLQGVAYGRCEDCVPNMVAARELLARIDGEEANGA